MSGFLEALHTGRVLLMDGAMGTELQRASLPPGERCEEWNLTHPERVRAIHQAYVDAGAEVLLTNTFQARPDRDVLRAALELARSAGGTERFVLLDVGPSGTVGRRPRAWQSVLAAMAEYADALLLETCSDISDCATMVQYRDRRDFNFPVLLSWTYRRGKDGQPRTIHGYLPEECAACANRYAIAALGVNCGRDIGMDEVIEIVRRYRQVTELPLFARPNAGTPIRDGDHWVYPQAPALMAARLPELLEAGVCMVGGCCGTTPEHMAAFRRVIEEWNVRR